MKVGGSMVDQVAAGRGNVALVPDLFTATVRAVYVVGVRTSFRFHSCPQMRAIESFSAAGWRKKRPDSPTADGGGRKGRT